MTVLLPKSRDILEKEDEENTSFSEIVSPAFPTAKKIKGLANITRTITMVNFLHKRSSKNLNLTEVSREIPTRNSIKRDSILKSPTKLAHLPTFAHKKLNEFLNYADFKNIERFLDKGRFKYIVSKVLTTGMAFGEIDNKKTLRNEAIVCNEDCHLAVMTKQDYKEILVEIEGVKRNKELEFLGNTFLKDAPFFTKDTFLAFRAMLEKKKFKTGAAT